ncbi:hypothetical protein L9F63_006636, partial [Diploptera punctata]
MTIGPLSTTYNFSKSIEELVVKSWTNIFHVPDEVLERMKIQNSVKNTLAIEYFIGGSTRFSGND